MVLSEPAVPSLFWPVNPKFSPLFFPKRRQAQDLNLRRRSSDFTDVAEGGAGREGTGWFGGVPGSQMLNLYL